MHDSVNTLLKESLEEALKYWYSVRQDYYMQRSRENILTFDDKNTKYFHDKVKLRKRRTQIECLKRNIGIWMTDKSMIATELRDHFSKMSRSINPPSDSSFLEVLMNHNFISLIPKNNAPKTPADFRPISLSNVIYKIISKLLASRLKIVMDKFISPYQAFFLSSRKVTDNIVIAHELVDTMRKNRTKSGLMAIKLDMFKAFDTIEWKFLIDILKKLGFHEHRFNLIRQCVSAVSTSIFLNGYPGEVYYPTRGLRQGYPLSPYLFIICIDVTFKGARKSMLDKFSKYSGQAINFEKSGIAFSPKTEPINKYQILSILKIKNLGLDDKYLGVPLLLQRNKMDSFKHLEESCEKRLDTWQGGLNIRKTEYLDTALLETFAWIMLTEPDALWVQILRHKYFPNSNPLHVVSTESVSWVWKGICRGLDLIRKHYCWEVGDGSSIEIWKDGRVPSKDTLLSSTIASNGMKTINQLLVQGTGEWKVDTLNCLFDRETVTEVCKIRVPFSGKDILKWSPTHNGLFSVKSAYKCILHDLNGTETSSFPWKALWSLNLPQKHDIKTANHLFVECEVTKRLWFALDANIAGSIATTNLQDWITSWFQTTNASGTNHEKYVQFASFAIWQMWKLRCSVVFDNGTVHAVKLVA
ncbi:uncharacterized protein LOC113290639 [Papaver somniferum]|uniref:uncharacterized protein LOC113290639 n=1 Tax=Papaver somniferum TaxID=3469 RepID=UPI000E6FA051|nr:uncharacterized protein LOC113290639 [Papaver somniferum]